jgi:hypothetical protein
MRGIGSTKNTRVAIDSMKNRLHVNLFGDALRADENQQVPAFVEQGCAQLKPGFTCLADYTQLKLFGLPDVARDVMAVMMRAGVRKVATVWPDESFAKLVLGSAAKDTGDAYLSKRQTFTDLDSAKAWLDK